MLNDNLLTSHRGYDFLSIRIHRGILHCAIEYTIQKNHGIFHVRILLKDIFGFTEHQDKAIYGLGYKLTLKRNIDSIVVSRNTAFADGQIT